MSTTPKPILIVDGKRYEMLRCEPPDPGETFIDDHGNVQTAKLTDWHGTYPILKELPPEEPDEKLEALLSAAKRCADEITDESYWSNDLARLGELRVALAAYDEKPQERFIEENGSVYDQDYGDVCPDLVEVPHGIDPAKYAAAMNELSSTSSEKGE